MKATPCTIAGAEYPSIRAAARALGKHPNTVYFWVHPRRVLDKNAAWHRNNRERSRAIRRRMAKLPSPTHPCPDRCEICRSLPGNRALHLDHDHKTGEFRGWLCSRCNTGLGLFRDNAALLSVAISYLEESRECI